MSHFGHKQTVYFDFPPSSPDLDTRLSDGASVIRNYDAAWIFGPNVKVSIRKKNYTKKSVE